MNVLITGKTGYVGKHLSAWLAKSGHQTEMLSVRDSAEYQAKDFGQYDALVHVAALVHVDDREVSWEDFHKVNTELTLALAQKAKSEGCPQFIFISTMGVYGEGKALPNGNVLTKDSTYHPTAGYGKSKYLAEEGLKKLEDATFKVAIIRPPSIHGKGCPGNYIATFSKLAHKLPVFPKAFPESKQSFIYIDSLTELIRLIIESQSSGVYLPQDGEPLSTVELLEIIAKHQGNRMHFSRLLGYAMELFKGNAYVNKLYGGISYPLSDSLDFDGKYQLYSTDEAMSRYLAN